MKLIIAEKHSVAQNIAHSVGAYEIIKSDENDKVFCYANNEYFIAHAKGHLYSLAQPNEYGWEKDIKKCYQNGELPMIPSRFKTVENPEDNLQDLRNFLKSLINNPEVTEIINGCDAGREGELIFREIYEASKSDKPVFRLWISSVTETAIIEGLKNLKPSSEYDNYYKTAKIRAKLDWIFGMNMSRLYTALDEGYVHSVGRVVTPVLGIIVNRDKEIKNFVSDTTYKLKLDNNAISENEFKAKSDAEQMCSSSIATVESVTKDKCSKKAPRLYSLTRLQMDANDEYGYTANETLSVAQSLYEKKYTTYPRSSSEYLPFDLKDTISELIKMLSVMPEFTEKISQSEFNPDVVINNDEVSDHHAIIPTIQSNIDVSSLSEKEKNIYYLICNRFLMAMDKPYIYSDNNYIFRCNDMSFTLKTISDIDIGWKKYSSEERNTSSETYSEGQSFLSNITLKECISQPKKHYTDKSILSVMLNIDNRIDDEDLKSAVKGKGLGTEATRASIIDKLVKNKYIERKGKQLVATEFGIDFVNSLPSQLLSVERTAEWEQMFDEIEKNGMDESELYEETCQLTKSVIDYEKNNNRKQLVNPNPDNANEVIGKCPRCGKDVIDKGNFYGCNSWKGADNPGCGFSFPKKHHKGWFEGSVTSAQAKKLLSGETISKKTKTSEGKTYDASWKIFDNGVYVNYEKVAETKSSVVGKCPRCNGDIVDKGKFYGCNSWKGADNPGCGFSFPKTNTRYNITITRKNAEELIKNKSTVISSKTLSGTKKQHFILEEKEINGKIYVNIVLDGGK